jgi:O-antigen ligase
MKEKNAAEILAQIIYFGVPIVSLLVVTGGVTDPVNSTKLTALVAFSFSVLILLVSFLRGNLLSVNRSLVIVSVLFLIASAVSVIASASPISQSIYGAYGRSTGFLAYFALIIFMLGAASLNQTRFHDRIIVAFLVTGIVNVAYCAWVLVFGDFIGWYNPYGEILGLFGNPNFIGAFLGMFLVGLTAVMLRPGISLKWRAFGLLTILITFFEIVKSKAVQGLIVTFGGLALVGFLLLWSKKVKPIWTTLYLAVFSGIATLSILGALQRGPFTFIYKRSVSLRGTYWESGIEMGMRRPFTGVGMDAYGDWYRRARPPRALTDTPGIETVTNAAHNVFLDLFAYGGFPLLLSYLTLLTFGLRSVILVLRRRSIYDGTFVALVAIWVCYQVQSIISINQLGLAVWGWVLTGALISYERVSQSSKRAQEIMVEIKSKKSQNLGISQSPVSPGLIAAFGLAIGVIIALPPVSADNKWWTALQSRNLEEIEASLSISYFNPANSKKYSQAVDLMIKNNLPDLALKYARSAVEFNPEDFTAWFQLYSLPNITSEDKATALANLKRLDPLNPDISKL